MKKWLACLLALAALCSALPAYAADSLLISTAPVTTNAVPTAGGAAEALHALGLVGGYGNNADGSVNLICKRDTGSAAVLLLRTITGWQITANELFPE